MRHSTASWLAERVPYAVLREILGHSAGSVTLRYAHSSWGAKIAAVESLPKLLHEKPGDVSDAAGR
jgi:integrase